MNPESKAKNIPQTTFFSIQCGIIKFNVEINQAYLVLGNDKTGKTVCSHYLMKNKLIGAQDSQNRTIYKLVQKSDALLNENTDSPGPETIIPNIFPIPKTDKRYLIDCPGFVDSFGSLKSISKNHFLCKVLLKCKKIKFILVIKQCQLQDSANEMKRTFISFLDIFNQNDTAIKQYKSSVCLLINEVAQNNSLQIVKKKYIQTQELGKQKYNKVYKQLKQQLLKNNQIFIIKKAIKNQQSDTSNNILQQIDQTCNYWQIKSQNQLKITIYDYIQNRQYFQKQFNEAQQYYKKQLKINLQMFRHKCQVFVQQHNSSYKHTILRQLIQMEQKQKKLIKQNIQYCKLYIKFTNVRIQDKNQMFKWRDLFIEPLFIEPLCPKIDQNQIPKDLQIMKAYLKIIIITQKIKNIGQENILKIVQQIKYILTIFINLTKQNQDEQNKVISYSYNLYMKILAVYSIYCVFMRANRYITSQDIEIPQLKKCIQTCKIFPNALKKTLDFVNTKCYKILINYITKQINQNQDRQKIAIYYYYKKFIKDTHAQLQTKSQLQLTSLFHIDLPFYKKIQKIFFRKIGVFQLKILQHKTYYTQRRYLHKILQQLKNHIFPLSQKIKRYSNLNKQQKQQKNKDCCDLIRILHLMAYCTKQMKYEQTACKIYQLLNDVDSILQYYQKKQLQIVNRYNIKNTQSKKQLVIFLTQYMKKLYKYHKIDLSLKKAQKGYSIAQNIGDQQYMVEIGKFIKMLCQCNKKAMVTSIQQSHQKYINFVGEGVSFVKFSDNLNREIQEIIIKYDPNL